MYGNDGISPDPNKIEDIGKMPTPQAKEDLQRFIGLMNYLAAYIPHFADKVSPLRELLKKDVPFVWHEDHKRTYYDLKRCIGSQSCLSYYHPQKETVVEVGASQKGLGACILQDKNKTCRVCIEDTHTDTVSIFENRTRDTGDREWCHKVPHVSLWQTLHHHNRSQTFAHGTQQADEECTSTSTTPSDQDTEIRLSARVSMQ